MTRRKVSPAEFFIGIALVCGIGYVLHSLFDVDLYISAGVAIVLSMILLGKNWTTGK